jgi:MerR HTH family regulatory protein
MDGLTIGDVAKEAKVNIETLRYYERRGLLVKPLWSTSNYRLYAEDTVRRVRFIKGAQELGDRLGARGRHQRHPRRLLRRPGPGSANIMGCGVGAAAAVTTRSVFRFRQLLGGQRRVPVR